MERAVAGQKAARWLALDLFRFLAVVLMVQGHTFYVVIEEAVRSQRWYGYHGYVHGFTAPIFLFSSGIAFGITTFRRWDQHLTFGPAVRRRFERYAILLLIGYALQLPVISFWHLISLDAESLARALKVNALQHIAITLAVCELLVLALRTRLRFVLVLVALCAAAVFSGPWMWRLPVDGLPIWLAAYVNASTGSIFPLVPWSGFILAGVIAAHFLWTENGVRARPYVPLLIAGAAFLLIGDQFAHSPFREAPFGEHNFWKTSPWFYFIRLGVVLLVFGALCLLDALWSRRRVTQAPLLQKIGQETLVIYVVHLAVLYSLPWGGSIQRHFDHALGVADGAILFGVFFAGLVVFSLGWHHLKKRWPDRFDRTRYALTALCLVLFFVRVG